MSTQELMNVQVTPSVESLISAFLSGRSPQTIEAYRIDLENFRSYLQASSIQEAAKILLEAGSGQANACVLHYRNGLKESGLQHSTINRRLAAIRSMVKLARTFGLIAWSLEVENLKVESYRDTRGPGQIAIREMLTQLEAGTNPKDVRDIALVRLLFDLALRASEVTGLNIEDVDLGAGTISVLGKGKSQKVTMTLPPQTTVAITNWIWIRGIAPGPLFFNYDRARKGQRLTRAGLYQVVRRLGEKVDVKTRPHGIRHTAVTQAIKLAQVNGITLPEVKQFSRHASLQTLQIYADRERDVGGRLAALVSQSAEPERAKKK